MYTHFVKRHFVYIYVYFMYVYYVYVDINLGTSNFPAFVNENLLVPAARSYTDRKEIVF